MCKYPNKTQDYYDEAIHGNRNMTGIDYSQREGAFALLCKNQRKPFDKRVLDICKSNSIHPIESAFNGR